jgi:tetratricopeptide (TPR) repeat protein
MADQGGSNDGGSGDGTRTGFGRTLFGNTGTGLDKRRVQIQSKGGKIYGPFERKIVLSFILEKKLTGEEKILYEGQADWKDIFSDIEFFDYFQKVQSGQITTLQKVVEKPPKEKTIAKSEIPKTVIQAEDILSEKDATQVGNPGSRPPTRDVSRPVKPRPAPKPLPESSESITPNWNIPQPVEMKPKRSKSSGPLLAVVILALVLGFYFVSDQGPSLDTPRKLGTFQTSSHYGRPLVSEMSGLALEIPAMPPQLLDSNSIEVPIGFGAAVWIADLKELIELNKTNKRNSDSYWFRWAWNLFWLGTCVEAIDTKSGEIFLKNAKAIYGTLEKRKLLSQQEISLFSILGKFRTGDWVGASQELGEEQPDEPEIVALLREEASWQFFWANDAKGKLIFSKKYASFSTLEAEYPSQLRKAFLRQDRELVQRVLLQYVQYSPLSSALWFTVAELNWRLSRETAQVANTLFQTGLGVLSLWPKSFQLNYWSEYSKYLKTFGRQAVSTKAAANMEILRSSDVNQSLTRGTFFDLLDADFQLMNLGNSIYEKSQKGVLELKDLATLAVLGRVLPEGNNYLYVAGAHLGLSRKWMRAEEFFKIMTDRNPGDIRGWGGLVWVNAQKYAFDKALQYHDELVKKASLARAEFAGDPAKYLGLVQSIGLEIEEAEKNFDVAIRANPKDGWAHYFLAEHHERMQKNVACFKSANLARLYGLGELRLRAELLMLKCRIGSRVDIRGALKTLEGLATNNPFNIDIKLSYADALTTVDQINPAIQYIAAEKDKFPNSFDLRMKLGDLHVKNKQYIQAIALYERALQFDKGNPEPNFKIGQIFFEQSNWAEAALNFETAATYDENYPAVWLWVARAYSKSGNIQKALIAYNKEIEIRPAVLATFLEVAEYLLSQNAPAEVPKLFQKFSQDFQDDPRVLTRLAQAYLAMQEFENAQKFAVSAIAQNNKIAEAHRVLGFVYENLAYYEKAKEHFVRYLDLLPSAADAQQIRVRISRPPY